MKVSMRAFPLLSLALVCGCSFLTAPGVLGNWGGREASLVLARSGGTLSYACGAGTIDSGWTLTPSGDFTASGRHFFGGGPAPAQGRPPHPARYAGVVDGDTLSLTVTVTDLGETLGPFHLVRGGPPVLEQCV